jgi:hypothetical protein
VSLPSAAPMKSVGVGVAMVPDMGIFSSLI